MEKDEIAPVNPLTVHPVCSTWTDDTMFVKLHSHTVLRRLRDDTSEVEMVSSYKRKTFQSDKSARVLGTVRVS